MQVKNSRISRYKIKKILKLFSVDVNATTATKILVLNRNTINRFYKLSREIIYNHQVELFEELRMNGLIEVDESYF
jgi:hypothetical protein